MSTLATIRAAITLRLKTQSDETLKTVEEAARCIRFLHGHGCTVQQVTVRPGWASVDIDAPGDWLQGSVCIRRVNGRYRELVMVTKVLGCQVQWMVREAHPLLQREGWDG